LLYAGTERHVYVSFDDGANWQSLQLNLPAASMRDIVFNGDDVILGTHGRGIWILDNASPLRQVDARVAQSGAYLFNPAVAYRTRPGSDEGTPLPLDEAWMSNPPSGAMIDYYIGSANTPVTISIVDSAGRTVRHWSSTDKPQTVNPKSLDIPMYWVHPQLPPSASHGSHRWMWDMTYADKVLAPPGRYTVRLSVNGKTSTQPLTLRRDPTYPASDADLLAQFRLAQQIEAQLDAVKAAIQHAQTLVKTHPQVRTILGEEPPSSPDDSIGKPWTTFDNLLYIRMSLENLESAVEGADARPTPDHYAAFAVLERKAGNALRALARVH
jgi:hypothetical protein